VPPKTENDHRTEGGHLGQPTSGINRQSCYGVLKVLQLGMDILNIHSDCNVVTVTFA